MNAGQVKAQMAFLQDLHDVLERHQCVITPIDQEESCVWFSPKPLEGEWGPPPHQIDFYDFAGEINCRAIKKKQEEVLFKALGKGKIK